jgi:hypothetical protein
MQTHRHLTVGDLAQSPAVLSRHSHRSRSCLGERGFANHPHFRFSQQINYLLGQLLLDLLHRPRTLTDKLPQSLNVGPVNPASQRLDGLAPALHQQAPQINFGPATRSHQLKIGPVFDPMRQLVWPSHPDPSQDRKSCQYT